MEILNQYSYRHGFTKAILQEACALFRSQDDALKLRRNQARADGRCILCGVSPYGSFADARRIAAIVQCVSLAHCPKPFSSSGFMRRKSCSSKTQLSLAERMMNGLSVSEEQRGHILDAINDIFKSPDEELEHTPKVMVAGVLAKILSTGKTQDRAARVFMKEFSAHSGVSVVSIQKVMNAM